MNFPLTILMDLIIICIIIITLLRLFFRAKRIYKALFLFIPFICSFFIWQYNALAEIVSICLFILFFIAAYIEYLIRMSSEDNEFGRQILRIKISYEIIKNNIILKRIYKHLKNIHKKNPQLILENCNTKIKLIINKHSVYLYCINKNSESGELERFKIGGSQPNNLQEVIKTWDIFEKKHTDRTTFKELLDLYKQTFPTRKIDVRGKIAILKKRNYELHFILSTNPYLCCKKVKAAKQKKKKHKTTPNNTSGKYFVIKGDIGSLYDVYYDICNIHIGVNNYDKLLDILSQRKDCSVEQNIYKPKEKEVRKNKEQNKLLDINNALEAEFAKLPGVNIILAKRIVQKREEINGFKNKKEFYEFCKLKPHFTEQLDNLIFVGTFDIIGIIMREDERTVDTIDEYDDIEIDDYDDDDDITVDL